MIDELFGDESWGLHDAALESMRVDWRAATFELDLRSRTTERADRDRLARLRFDGLVFLAIDGPGTFGERSRGLWIDGADGVAPRAPANPPLSEDATPAWLYVNDWNGFIRFGARIATLSWLEPEDRPLSK